MKTALCIRRLSVSLSTLAIGVSAETIDLQPTADTSIIDTTPQFNLGAQEDLPAGTLGSAANSARSRILVKFDVAAGLPAGATIRSATLKFTVTRVPDGGGASSIFSVHRILRPWGEGTKKGNTPGGAPAGPLEATWQMRFHPDQPWAGPGGQPGTDYLEAPSSSERVQDTGTYEFEFGASTLLEIQEWLRDSSTNFGWMLVSESENVIKSARRFAARENPQPGSRPTLTIEYAAAIPTSRITGISLTNGEAVITFSASAGVKYGLQAREAFGQSAWETLLLLAVTSSAGELALTNEIGTRTQRFYRILASD